jgi:transketolase
MVNRAPRDAYGEALIELGNSNPRIVVLDADLSRSTYTSQFGQQFPNRFFNVGIAEQNLVGVAAGLSMTGLVPFATTYAIFIGRAFDQIRQAVCFSGTNVKIIATHAGLAASHDGGSHQGILDIALMRSLPGMIVISPSDYYEARQAVFAAVEHNGPVYIRLQKEPVPILTSPDEMFKIGPAKKLRDGHDVALFATGSMVHPTIIAAETLQQQGIEASVVAVSTLKPIDAATIREVCSACGCFVSAEEHSRYGGLYDSILHVLAGEIRCPSIPIALNDCFGDTGDWQELRIHFGLSSKDIEQAALRAISIRDSDSSFPLVRM